MLFRQRTLEGIAGGEITIAFRRSKRPVAKSGGSVRTAIGVVRLGVVEMVNLMMLTNSDALLAGFATLAALREMLGPDDGGAVYRVELKGIEVDERLTLRKAAITEPEWNELTAKFARWNERLPGYFPSILQAIGSRPGVSAATLALDAGVEKLKFKHDVRKLKELGLTESLDVGYRLSPRGEAVLAKLREDRL